MKRLLNTLYITNPSFFLGIAGENIALKEKGKIIYRYPLHNLEAIIVFSHSGVSAELLQKCAEYSIALSVLNPFGRLAGRFVSPSQGNVLLRRKQIETSLDEEASLAISRNVIAAKIVNSKNFLQRFRSQYALRIQPSLFDEVIDHLRNSKNEALQIKLVLV